MARKLTIPKELMSALVNLVDTARENPDEFNGYSNGLQLDREIQIRCFLNISMEHHTLKVKNG